MRKRSLTSVDVSGSPDAIHKRYDEDKRGITAARVKTCTRRAISLARKPARFVFSERKNLAEASCVADGPSLPLLPVAGRRHSTDLRTNYARGPCPRLGVQETPLVCCVRGNLWKRRRGKKRKDYMPERWLKAVIPAALQNRVYVSDG